ncbi:MAG: glycosyltransferase [Phycisphaerae bacterium]|nr:glycosyltransferase [Saprospiraceae bacterium]
MRHYLPAVLAQQFDAPWELLVVDDASKDETPAVLQSFQEKNLGVMRVVRIAEKTSPGKKYALSQGIAAAKYDHLLLTDADCQPASPHWLAHIAAALTAKPETEIVLGYGPNFAASNSGQTTLSRQTTAVPSSDGSKPSDEYAKKNKGLVSPDEYAKKETQFSLWSRYETAFVAAQYFSFALVGMPYMGVGRNLAFKRQIFDRVGGFISHLQIPSGDDDLLVNAAATARNTAICLEPESFVYSDAPKNWSAWLRQKQRHLAAGSVYRWPHKIILGILGFSHAGFYFLFAVLILARFNPMIVVGIFLLRLFSILFVFGKILRVLREPGLWWRIPLFDPLMAVYYGAVAPWLLISKKRAGWGRQK